jgi:hypothetical protein
MRRLLRLIVATSVAVVAMTVPVNSSAAESPQKPATIDSSFYAAHANEISGFTAELAPVVGHVHIAGDANSFTYDSKLPLKFQRQVDNANRSIRAYEAQSRAPAPLVRLGAQAVKAFWCIYVARWMLEVIAWYYIAQGALYTAIGLFVDGTIVGIPMGVILNLIGIGVGFSGGFLLWWADTYFRPGWYCSWR